MFFLLLHYTAWEASQSSNSHTLETPLVEVPAHLNWSGNRLSVCTRVPLINQALKQWSLNTQLKGMKIHKLLDLTHFSAISDPMRFKWIYYKVSQGEGGFADRLSGVINALFYAIITNRGFGLEWDTPVDIRKIFSSSDSIPWLKSPELSSFANVSQVHLINHDYDYEIAKTILSSTSRVLYLKSNTNWIDDFIQTPEFRHIMTSVYDASESVLALPTHQSVIFSCLFRQLFEPRGKTLRLYQQVLSKLQNNPGSKLNCVQLRLGQGGQQTWTGKDCLVLMIITNSICCIDGMPFLTMNQIPSIANEFMRLTHGAKGSFAFVTSDSDAAAEAFYARTQIDEQRRIFYNFSHAIHVDLVQGSQFEEAFTHVVVNFLVLSLCDLAILTERSGFGRLGILLKGPAVFRDLNARVFYAMRESEISNTTKSFLGFCDYLNPAYNSIYSSKCVNDTKMGEIGKKAHRRI